MAERYSISSVAEAEAYLSHPILGPRLTECTEIVNNLAAASADSVFGYPDKLKFRSCVTLFAEVAGEDSPFQQALDKFFGGESDRLTIELL